MTHDARDTGAIDDSQTLARIDEVADAFERQWAMHGSGDLESYLSGWQGPSLHRLLRELVAIEVSYRVHRGEQIAIEEYLARFPGPEAMSSVRDAFQWLISRNILPLEAPRNSQTGARRGSLEDSFDPEDVLKLLRATNRYAFRRLLGCGAFARVYAVWDSRLEREVAMKHFVARDIMSQGWLVREESRALASLDHRYILPVYDIGELIDGSSYLTSKWIAGGTLAERMAQGRLALRRAVEIVRDVACALEHAHAHQIVHRDLKPSNLLLDQDDRVYLADFGLALRPSQFGVASADCGTPAYMSPEQIRGEGHLVDGRSDLFSLGVVFYELLTGERPFTRRRWPASDVANETQFARPPRQMVPEIPLAVERICLRLLEPAMRDRYSSAREVIDDLEAWLAQSPVASRIDPDAALHLMPKGLQAFGPEDAAYFLRLLPGPRDADGLPESVRFWKRRIEARSRNETFRLGVLYGPSGSGKTSLVRAGVIPQLASHVRCHWVDASLANLEAQLVWSLHETHPDLKPTTDLAECLSLLRTTEVGRPNTKDCLWIDQFEQVEFWEPQRIESLARAFRQADGVRIQIVLVVRDDYWATTTRFLDRCDETIRTGLNSALIDRLDVVHARRLLQAFGEAYQVWHREGERADRATIEAFLDAAVEELAEQGRVVCARLSLFAQMMAPHSWTSETLARFGGVVGLMENYLDDLLVNPRASARYRAHRDAIINVFLAVLPEEHVNVKSGVVTEGMLRESAGYLEQPRAYEDLKQLLIHDLKILTLRKTDVGVDSNGDRLTVDAPVQIQLTHDYLIAPIRLWLARHNQTSREGRIERRLNERARVWELFPEARALPTVWEDIQIRLFVPRRRWTKGQVELMRRSGRRVAQVGAAAFFCLITGVAAIWYQHRSQAVERAHLRVEALFQADFAQLGAVLPEVRADWRWTEPRIRLAMNDPHRDRRTRAYLALGEQASEDDAQRRLELVTLAIREANVLELAGWRQVLADDPALARSLVQHLVPHIARPSTDARSSNLREIAVLTAVDAKFLGEGDDAALQAAIGRRLVDELLREITGNPSSAAQWTAWLRPIGPMLKPWLVAKACDASQPDLDRYWAAEIVCQYVADDSATLVEILEYANDSQFPLALQFWQRQQHDIRHLEERWRSLQTERAKRPDLHNATRRVVQIAIAAAHRGAPQWLEQIWATGQPSDVAAHAVHRVAPLKLPVDIVWMILSSTKDPQAIYHATLALGTYPRTALSLSDIEVLRVLEPLVASHPDVAVHSACTWLGGVWNLPIPAKGADPPSLVDVSPAGESAATSWRVNTRAQVFAELGPVEFAMGSPDDDPLRLPHEDRHQRIIPRVYWISTTEVTVAEFQEFARAHWGRDWEYRRERAPEPTCPQTQVTWYAAAAYCNWLSAQESIPSEEWSYQPNAQGEYAQGMTIVENALQCRGYRLPTEAEWEYACRGLTETARFFGDDESLLEHYARFDKNAHERTWPVIDRMPNRLGLFHSFGNVWEWCHDRFDIRSRAQERVRDDVVASEVVRDDDERINRGGTFATGARYLRAAVRNHDPPTKLNANYGFRVARTIRPVPEFSTDDSGSRAARKFGHATLDP